MPEVRPLPSAGVTRPQRSYEPVRLPSGRHLVRRLGWRTPPDRVSPDNPCCLTSVLCPLPRRIGTGAYVRFPSPFAYCLPRYPVGSASASLLSRPAQALLVTAHWLAQPPKA